MRNSSSITNDESGNALAAHYAMQGRSVGGARLSTVGRENLGSARVTAAPATRARTTTTNRFAKSHLRLAAMVVVRLDGEADLGRLQPNFEGVAVGVREVAASGGRGVSCCGRTRKQTRAGVALHRIQRLHCEGEAMVDEEIEGVDVGSEQGCTVAAHGFEVVDAGVLGAVGGRG